MTAIGSGCVSDTGRRSDAASGAAGWLALAAAPVFLLMAVLTALGGGGTDSGMDMMCGRGAYLLTGMVPMYLLMSVVHAAPWLRLMFGRADPERG
jgi:hypothetical protein